jgi:putative hydrolase of the HAD superfamily
VALEREHGLERFTLLRTYFACDEWNEVQVGRGDIDAWREAAHRHLEKAAGGRTLPRLHEQWRSQVRFIRENIELVRSLRPPYRTAVLSNADITLEERMRDVPGLSELFDTVVCSAAVGMAKPDLAIYRLAAERLGLRAEECLFVDDAEANVSAAREAGMTAVHFRIHHGDDLGAQLAEHGVSARSN